ncbi:hypothetical protein V8F20_007043 [Naviculisporaceae sp. PSN 640]
MAPKDTTSDITSSVGKLSIQTAAKPKAAKKKKAPVADSWEDEDVSSSESEHEQDPATASTSKDGSSSAGTSAPPPTPMSPTYGSQRPFSPTGLGAQSFDRKPTAAAGPYYDGPADSFGPSGVSVAGDRDTRARPEKTDAVARRMIAASLGLKAPKLTEEQKAYDRAIREKEKRRKEEERALQKKREEEAAKAKQAVWED